MAKQRQKPEPEAKEQKPEVVTFLSWFVEALDTYPSLKPHHMNSVKAFFLSHGLTENESPADFDKALKVYGI